MILWLINGGLLFSLKMSLLYTYTYILYTLYLTLYVVYAAENWTEDFLYYIWSIFHLHQLGLYHALVLCLTKRMCVNRCRTTHCVCAQGRDSGRTSGFHLSTPALIQTLVTRFEGKIRKCVETNDFLQVRDDDTNGIGLKVALNVFFHVSPRSVTRLATLPFRWERRDSSSLFVLRRTDLWRRRKKHWRRTKGNTSYRHP